MKNKNKQTKFPVARIKKIMQKDEEVGKVAQATPIVISKALELFLGLLIEESTKVTTDRGSKKVEAYHLKHAVDTTETLDFLKEIVEAVPDPSAGGTIDLEAENAEGKKKRKSKKPTAAAAAVESGEGGTTTTAAPKRRRRKKPPVEGEEVEMGKKLEVEVEPPMLLQRRDAEGDMNMDDYDEEEVAPRRKSPEEDDEDWDE
ncbi:transcriptional regulator family: Histone-like TF [Agaricus bisporus var. burnettii]|uniref:Transcriptional regulator family: Histone-like TF n=1 Tax=Agaricus bisporus var. burnettii TaxID=192524 RepID=A0A8H7C2J7_AGABI|nr:transcriptional regulator family: Histone-like TF [Agaricus bisporus var. burnettii]